MVNAYTVNSQLSASVAVATGVGFVVAWQSYGPPGQFDIFARPFSSGGAPLASEFQVNLYTVAYQTSPAVASGADGDFVVVWQTPQDGSGNGIFGRAFSSSGSPDGAEFQVNSYTTASSTPRRSRPKRTVTSWCPG